MESIREQMSYGNVCKPHGVNIGTPMGADLMCQLCEMGMDTWVKEKGYTLWFRFDDADLQDDTSVPWTRVAEWQEGDAPSWSTLAVGKSVEPWFELFNDPTITRETMSRIQHKVTVTSQGYWSE
jgi:hypothetical protein